MDGSVTRGCGSVPAAGCMLAPSHLPRGRERRWPPRAVRARSGRCGLPPAGRGRGLHAAPMLMNGRNGVLLQRPLAAEPAPPAAEVRGAHVAARSARSGARQSSSRRGLRPRRAAPRPPRPAAGSRAVKRCAAPLLHGVGTPLPSTAARGRERSARLPELLSRRFLLLASPRRPPAKAQPRKSPARDTAAARGLCRSPSHGDSRDRAPGERSRRGGGASPGAQRQAERQGQMVQCHQGAGGGEAGWGEQGRWKPRDHLDLGARAPPPAAATPQWDADRGPALI